MFNRLLGNQKPDYQIILSEETAERAEQYLQDLRSGKVTPGARFKTMLADKNLATISKEDFLLLLLQTKAPLVFAEYNEEAKKALGNSSPNYVFGTAEWNSQEFDLLSRIGTSVNVEMYDNGVWSTNDASPHKTPLSGKLGFVSGAVLKEGLANSNIQEIMGENGEINKEAFYKYYEERILPVLIQMNFDAKRRGEKLLITIPGIGGKSFAGVDAAGKPRQLQGELQEVLGKMLDKHGAALTQIKGIYYDPYVSDVTPKRTKKWQTEFIVNPYTGPDGKKSPDAKPQLGEPSDYGQQFKGCKVCSLVAGDPCSIPGNEGSNGTRNTDDGVKALATNLYAKLTGVRGKYNKERKIYEPPKGSRNWLDFLKKSNFLFGSKSMVVAKKDGTLVRYQNHHSKLEKLALLQGKLAVYARSYQAKKSLGDRNQHNTAVEAAMRIKTILDKLSKGEDISAHVVALKQQFNDVSTSKKDLKTMLGQMLEMVDDLISSTPSSSLSASTIMAANQEALLASSRMQSPLDMPPPNIPPPPPPSLLKDADAGIKTQLPPAELEEMKTRLIDANKTINNGIGEIRNHHDLLQHPSFATAKGELKDLLLILDSNQSTQVKQRKLESFMLQFSNTENFSHVMPKERRAFTDIMRTLEDINKEYNYFMRTNTRLKEYPQQGQELRAYLQQAMASRPSVSTSSATVFSQKNLPRDDSEAHRERKQSFSKR